MSREKSGRCHMTKALFGCRILNNKSKVGVQLLRGLRLCVAYIMDICIHFGLFSTDNNL